MRRLLPWLVFMVAALLLLAVWAAFFSHPTYGQCHQTDLGEVCKLLGY